MKTLKFKEYLIPRILLKEKYTTWRFFDDKNLITGEELLFINKDNGEAFGKAKVISICEKKFGNINKSDFDGHERFKDEAEMYKTYQEYYTNQITSESMVKIVKFRLL